MQCEWVLPHGVGVRLAWPCGLSGHHPVVLVFDGHGPCYGHLGFASVSKKKKKGTNPIGINVSTRTEPPQLHRTVRFRDNDRQHLPDATERTAHSISQSYTVDSTNSNKCSHTYKEKGMIRAYNYRKAMLSSVLKAAL
jgi:hypothetical protein